MLRRHMTRKRRAKPHLGMHCSARSPFTRSRWKMAEEPSLMEELSEDRLISQYNQSSRPVWRKREGYVLNDCMTKREDLIQLCTQWKSHVAAEGFTMSCPWMPFTRIRLNRNYLGALMKQDIRFTLIIGFNQICMMMWHWRFLWGLELFVGEPFDATEVYVSEHKKYYRRLRGSVILISIITRITKYAVLEFVHSWIMTK